ncbi:hypothetical protein Lal_00025509 [Lupinus albus]|uniref:Putative plant organelle RNA recognition domain-containing protein n=1 Tax=Lupinus albus TaxID=3870 RepID=A0A6A4PWK0_LUPAL|nr:putative plant organelle RNA recognition domain-containing protein [Lupinus albus]KAF1890176.1 hypothetical protein Lal_00025509 [Lupinus albus]
METTLSLSSPKPSSFSPLPFFVSNNSLLLQKLNLSLKPHCSLSPQNSHFFGTNLVLSHGNVNLIKTRNFHAPIWPINVAVKRKRENSFETVAQRDKRLRFVLKLRRILLREPDRTMSIKDLGRYRAQLGTLRKRQFVAMLKRFPAVFQVMEEGLYSLKFKMTPQAEKLYLEELKIRSEMEELLVMKLRKLLMMSLDKRILLKKITHLRTDFGLPQGFHETICYGYPQYFRVVATGRGPALELTHWDAELAVSAAELSLEENRIKEENDLLMERPERFNREKLLKRLTLSNDEIRRIMQFRDMPYISPYSDFSSIRSGTQVNEKHDCGVVHEILSLTVEKQTLVDNLSHFREEFGFSQQVRGMLIRHPDMFYVSLKGEMDCVFLREAYHGSELIYKDPLMRIKEKLRSLVAVPHQNGADRRDGNVLEKNDRRKDGRGEEEGEWSDAYNFMSDDRFGDYDSDDDWSHQEDDTPPKFFEDVEPLEIGQGSSFLFP